MRFAPIWQAFVRALDRLCAFVRGAYSLLPNLGVTGSNPVGVTNKINSLLVAAKFVYRF
jgi:hypothetical protein